MESPYFILKKRKENDFAKSLDIEDYSRSLPPPPPGNYWVKTQDQWELRKIDKESNLKKNENFVCFSVPTVIEHVVMPHDTLQGLCLHYRTSASAIRKANMFSGSSIQFKTLLRIPINVGVHIQLQANTNDVLLQRFRNETGEGIFESRVYMEEAHWNIKVALEAWTKDESWEQIGYLDTIYNSSMVKDTLLSEHTMVSPEKQKTDSDKCKRNCVIEFSSYEKLRSSPFSRDVDRIQSIVTPAAVRIPKILLPAAISLVNDTQGM